MGVSLKTRKVRYRTAGKRHVHWGSSIPSAADFHPAPSDMLSGLLLEDAVLFNAVRKVINPPDKQLFLGFVAGIWVGLAGLTAVSVAGGVPETIRSQWLSLTKFAMGTFFAFGKSSLNISK
jgi:hypothetical protein